MKGVVLVSLRDKGVRLRIPSGHITLLPPTQAEEHLSHVAQQFAQWRQGRANPRGSRIPAPLWTEAPTLAEVLPLTRVTRQLSLKPHALKRRRGDPGSPAVPATA